jgi:hypothetical protein
MPFFSMLDAERVDFSEPITSSEIDYLVSYPKIEVLQCSTPVKQATWELLDNEFFRRRPEVELRVYGPIQTACDLSFTARMAHVLHFTANTLMNATGVDAIAEMPNLQTLSIGVFELDNFDFLWKLTDRLTSLVLGETRSRKPDLSPLQRFKKLTRLFLVGQQKNIDVLSELKLLEDVTLSSISTPNVEYLKGLDHVWSLDIMLGGIRDFTEIEGMANIKYLGLLQVRRLNNVDFISRVPGLQNLMLRNLPGITALPSFRLLSHLRRVTLCNLKGIRDFSALRWAPALEEFILIQGQTQQPEDFIPVLRNPSLRRASAHFGSIRKERRFMKLLHDHGIEEYSGYRPFMANTTGTTNHL